MGKPDDDEFSLSSSELAAAEAASRADAERNRVCSNRFVSRVVGLRCCLALLFGISVFLSAVFWFAPFLKLQDPGDLDLDPRYRGHTIVARFTLPKPAALLKDNVAQLETDIYYELQAAGIKVTVLSLESSPGSNETDVVFGVDPESKHSSIDAFELSLIRSSFGFLVTSQTNLQLTRSLFGQPSSFEVLKFAGGIIVSPPGQIVFTLQQVQIQFNFTLNNSIVQIQENFEDLKRQLKSGLHLTVNENLYIRLSNSRGSTVAPPATVQTSVFLAVGVPSVPRLKQLAQTIKDSPARNLGLNNRVFGKVKQVSLSSILQHSLTGDASSPAPAPSPLPHSHHHHHHHHHHHDHHRHQDHRSYLTPSVAPSYSPVEAPPRSVKGSPAPPGSAPGPVKTRHAVPVGAPAPVKSYHANPPATPAPSRTYQASPPGCKFRFRGRHTSNSPTQSPTGSAVRPTMSPHHSAAPSPHPHANTPTPVMHRISPSNPLPNVIYARVPPPSGSETDPVPPDKMPAVAPSPSAGGRIAVFHWGFSVLVALLLHRW